MTKIGFRIGEELPRFFGASLRDFRSGTAASEYSAPSRAYFAAMDVEPDDARKELINELITGLVSAGVWAKLDYLMLAAAHDEQAGRINAANPTQVATAVNAPTFLADAGFTGDGSTSYLNSNWAAAQAVHISQNNAHGGVWVGTDVASTTQADFGTIRFGINSQAGAGLMAPFPNTATNSPVAVADGLGHSLWTRTAAAVTENYKNGVSLGEGTNASQATQTAVHVLIGARNASNTATPSPDRFSTRRIQAVHWGSALTDAEVTALYDGLNSYLQAI